MKTSQPGGTTLVATVSVDQLLAAAARVGVRLDKAEADGNLYLWHTAQGEVVYIGKSASDKRVADERSWCALNPRDHIYSGIVTLLRANHAQLQPLLYESNDFDADAWRALATADEWSGPAVDALADDLAERDLTSEDVEKLLVRIGVRYGAALGNSQFASQWEAPIGSTADTLAAISVYADTGFAP